VPVKSRHKIVSTDARAMVGAFVEHVVLFRPDQRNCYDFLVKLVFQQMLGG
jgi:hypothetical protein